MDLFLQIGSLGDNPGIREVNWALLFLIVSVAFNLIQVFWKQIRTSDTQRNEKQDKEVADLKAKHEREIESLRQDLLSREKNIDDKLSEILRGISNLSRAQAVSSQRTEEAFNKIQTLISDVKDIEVEMQELRDRIIMLEQKISSDRS